MSDRRKLLRFCIFWAAVMFIPPCILTFMVYRDYVSAVNIFRYTESHKFWEIYKSLVCYMPLAAMVLYAPLLALGSFLLGAAVSERKTIFGGCAAVAVMFIPLAVSLRHADEGLMIISAISVLAPVCIVAIAGNFSYDLHREKEREEDDEDL